MKKQSFKVSESLNSYNCEIWLMSSQSSGLKQNILAASANALKLLNNVNDLRISYKQLHKPHKRATPMNPMKYRVSIQLFKTYNGHIFNSDWLNIGITYEQVITRLILV